MDFGDFLWSLLIIYFMFFYFMLLFRIVGDLFRDSETSGLGKTAWIIFLLFLPFIAMIVYLITRGRRMAERSIAASQAAIEEQDEYIRRVAANGNGRVDPSAQIAKGHDLLVSGAISQQEFDVLKAKALA
jgi:hypothetical protein